MMRFCSLGSGSTGNATLIEASSGTRTTRVLVDCGFSLRELGLRLGRAGLRTSDIDAVFITHEHGDHVGCALALARQSGAALWMSHGTWLAIGSPELETAVRFARDGEAIDVGEMSLTPYTVPHDAREPLQLTCTDGAAKLGLLTDAGCATAHLLAHLAQCSALLLECNHDPALLAASRYPAFLKSRIGGRQGHLANSAAAEILHNTRHAGLRHVVAAHLSEQNNTPELAAAALAGALGCLPQDILVARPDTGFDWMAA